VKISIIIPTLNRSRLLNRTLFTLSEQITKHDFEIIVVDNGSTDDTRDIVEYYANILKINIDYLFDDRPGLLIGRNAGARKSKGEVLSFIDDDVILPPYWLESVVDVFRDRNISLATGNNYPFFESTPPEWLDHLWQPLGKTGRCLYQLSFLEMGNKNCFIDPIFVWGLNYHIRKEVYFRVGGFNPDILPVKYEHFIGDGETGIVESLKAHNFKAFFEPKISLYHSTTTERLTKSYFFKRSYTEGMMNAYSCMRSGYNPNHGNQNISSLYGRVKSLFNKLSPFNHNRDNKELFEVKQGIVQSFSNGISDYLTNYTSNDLIKMYVKEINYLDIDYISSKYYN